MTTSTAEEWPTGKAGFVAIIGRPNVGKSTFLNRILDYPLVAVSPVPQTTRRLWRGIYSDAESQIVFVDTPGMYEGRTVLTDNMRKAVNRSLQDPDLVLCMCDPSRPCGKEDELVVERARGLTVPVIVALNKSDITKDSQKTATEMFYRERLPEKTVVFEISALDGKNVTQVLDQIRKSLPEGPFFYPPDQITDAYMREIGAEVIREAAMKYLFHELPHAIAIEVAEWKETPDKLKIFATVYVESESQKPIILGTKGETLNKIRRDSVTKLKQYFDQRIQLKLFVKVASDWRNRKGFLKDIGLS